ncbi:hypothetical protein BCR33DRAFT_318612 [Rhizoclosmatium globosum]|uniref:Steroid 5-alpha reductase C-terminal domain-containing protein n=1 Tax=Rhizoclosmatium globosum TaxID=329046 RepID=A0A1Y2CZL5_9FUNG|nr:hypothetical protein BCR33DRAFT_318612 [Rhizoclosmatium globosum]|eukprot:ORY52478.1 hypothetical protein BCR33DRAFT_318612 [Rhizoclosmatium globosum]
MLLCLGLGMWIGNCLIQLLLSFVVLLVIETVADQQQWNFQEKKWGMIKAGKKVENLPAPYNLGFLTSGLFAYSRHPNFFAEFSIWWTLCLFAVSASGDWTNYEALLGAALLNLLFWEVLRSRSISQRRSTHYTSCIKSVSVC